MNEPELPEQLARRWRERGAPWLAGRARNAMRRSVLIGAVGGVAFVGALVALVLVPRQASREARAVAPQPGERPDTAPLIGRELNARRALTSAESTLVARREAARRVLAPAVPAAPVDTAPPEVIARRDSIARSIGSLNRLLARVQNAPLPSSYRALGEAPEVRTEPHVRALLDSLDGIERERDAFGGLGGVDPLFVALTARAADVGQRIEEIGQARRLVLRRELAALSPPTPAGPDSLTLARATRAAADTLALRAHVEALRQVLARESAALRAARIRNVDLDRRAARARELANVAAPPIALLAASLVIGVAVGYAAALARELRKPRLATASEAERITGVPVLAVIRPHAPNPERMRRRADIDLPPAIVTTSESYRSLYLYVSPTGAALPLVTVTGDDPAIVATVAANVAAASAFDARSTLLIDGDLANGTVASTLRIRTEPGVGDVLRGDAGWAETIVSMPIGRSGHLDVIPSGRRRAADAAEPAESAVESVRHDLARLAARYDLAVLVAPATHAERGARSILPAPDVIVCAHLGETPLDRLATEVQRLRHAGERVRGLVLWDVELPGLATREEIEHQTRSGQRHGRRATPVGSGWG